MGCDQSTVIPADRLQERRKKGPQRIGTLVVKIKSFFFHILEKDRAMMKDLVARIEVSNQFEEFDLCEISTKKGEETSCKFFINDTNKSYGRTLTAELWHTKSHAETQIGFGVFDLEPFINPKAKSKKIHDTGNKCFINYHHRAGGFFLFDTVFFEQKYTQITFQIKEVQIRRFISGLKNYFVRIVVGEAIFETHIRSHQNMFITFEEPEIFTCMVPQSLDSGLVQLISRVGNNDNNIGQIGLDLQLLSRNPQIIEEQLLVGDEDGEVSGSITIISTPYSKNASEENYKYELEIASPRKIPKKPLAVVNTAPQYQKGIEKQASPKDIFGTSKTLDTKHTINEAISIKIIECKPEEKREKIPHEELQHAPELEKEEIIPSIFKFPETIKEISELDVLSREEAEHENESKVCEGEQMTSRRGSMPPIEIQQALANLRGKRTRKKSIAL